MNWLSHVPAARVAEDPHRVEHLGPVAEHQEPGQVEALVGHRAGEPARVVRVRAADDGAVIGRDGAVAVHVLEDRVPRRGIHALEVERVERADRLADLDPVDVALAAVERLAVEQRGHLVAVDADVERRRPAESVGAARVDVHGGERHLEALVLHVAHVVEHAGEARRPRDRPIEQQIAGLLEVVVRREAHPAPGEGHVQAQVELPGRFPLEVGIRQVARRDARACRRSWRCRTGPGTDSR